MSLLFALCLVAAPPPADGVKESAAKLHQEADDFAPGRGIRSSTTASEVADTKAQTPTRKPAAMDQPGGPSPDPVPQPAVTPRPSSAATPGGPSPTLDVPVTSESPPNLNDSSVQSEQTKAYLRNEGERQVRNGKLMLYIGIPLAVVGTVLGVGGIVTVSNGRNPGGSGAAILGGLLLGSAGGGGIIAGSVLLHRGRKKLDRGQQRTPVATLSFRF